LKTTMCYKCFLTFILLILAVPLQAKLLATVGQSNNNEQQRLTSVVNSFDFGGDFFIAADLLQVNMDWGVKSQDREMRSLLANITMVKHKINKDIKDTHLRHRSDLALSELIKEIETEKIDYVDVIDEITWKETALQAQRSERNIFSNIAEFFLGWSAFTLNRRMNKVADALVKTSKALAMDEKALEKLKNYVQEVSQAHTDLLHVDAVISMLKEHASHVLRHFRAKTAFLKALARDQLQLSLLSFEHYSKLTHHTDKVINEANMRWVDETLDGAPFTVALMNDTLRISCYLTVQPKQAPRMEGFFPKEGIFQLNGTLFRTGKPDEALIAVSPDHHHMASLSYDDYGSCRKDASRIICYSYRTLHKAPKTCALARFNQSLEDVLNFCSMERLNKDEAYWIVQNQLMAFIGPNEKVQPVNETCGDKSQLLHLTHVPMKKDCLYETADMIIFADTKLTIKLDLDKAFRSEFKLAQLDPPQKAKVLELQLGSVKVLKDEDLYAFDPLKEYAGYIVLAVSLGTVVTLGSIGYCLYKHKRQVFAAVETLNPELAAADAARKAVSAMLEKNDSEEQKNAYHGSHKAYTGWPRYQSSTTIDTNPV